MKHKKRPKIKFTSKWLRKQFLHMNHRFFADRIPFNVKVEFGDLKEQRANGIWNLPLGQLVIDNTMKKVGELLILQILIHEMIHADLEYQHYKGYPNDAGHGMRFQAELVRLWNDGAFDGLL